MKYLFTAAAIALTVKAAACADPVIGRWNIQVDNGTYAHKIDGGGPQTVLGAQVECLPWRKLNIVLDRCQRADPSERNMRIFALHGGNLAN